MSQSPKVTPEQDELMWQLAESGEPNALEDFGRRYPDLRPEMTRRLNMVRSLKGSRPQQTSGRRFMPSRRDPDRPSPWVTGGLVVGLALGVAFVTFAAMQYLDGRRQTVAQTNPGVERPRNAAGSESGATETPDNTSGPVGNNPVITPGVPNPQFQPADPFQTKVTVVSGRVRLRQALDDIARQANITLEMAPGMPDLEIRCDYRDAPALAVLTDMGKNFGFTPMRQGDRNALLVPATDPTRRPLDGVGQSGAPVDPQRTPPVGASDPGALPLPADEANPTGQIRPNR